MVALHLCLTHESIETQRENGQVEHPNYIGKGVPGTFSNLGSYMAASST